MRIDDFFDVTYYEEKLPLDELLQVASRCKDLQEEFERTPSILIEEKLFSSLYKLGSNLIRYGIYAEGLKCFDDALTLISNNSMNYIINSPVVIRDNVPIEFFSIIETLTAFYQKTKQYDKLVSKLQENVFIKRGGEIGLFWGEIVEREAAKIQCLILQESDVFKNLIGVSNEWLIVLRKIEKYAKANGPILIKGPSGIGKEHVANAIHLASGRKSFKAINCAALTEELAGSELFGHERGSFTGAIKDRIGYCEDVGSGTLFLDEIDKTSKEFQGKLLRLVQEKKFTRIGSTEEKPFNGRIVAAINKDIVTAIEQDRFFNDLYWRLNDYEIDIPPLTERLEDIEALIVYFMKDAGTSKKISIETIKTISDYFRDRDICNKVRIKMESEVDDIEERKKNAKYWRTDFKSVPENNVRELKKIVNRLIVDSDGDKIIKSDLPQSCLITSPLSFTEYYQIPMEVAEATYKAKEFKEVMALTKNNQTKAGVLFRCTPQAINQRVK